MLFNVRVTNAEMVIVSPTSWNASGICRFSDDRGRWRVVVETWPERDGYHGRFVFEPDRATVDDRREGPDALRGDTREDLLAEAVSLPEQRLKQLFRSLA